MSDGKRLAIMGIAFLILQLGVLAMIVFFLAISPSQGPAVIHWLSLFAGFVMWAIAFWLLRIALRPDPTRPKA